jgi:hypothetical protein
MAVDRTYRCNLCRDRLDVGPGSDPLTRPIGLYWSASQNSWFEKPWREVENHICAPCLSSLQALPSRCGGGYECDGGPQCSSDHK